MKLDDVRNALNLEVAAGDKYLDREITGGYCGDLLSDVMANSPDGALWMTIQSHQNIVAVSVLREHGAIVLVNGRVPDDDTKAKAEEEGIPILLSPLSGYELAGRLYEMGIGKTKE